MIRLALSFIIFALLGAAGESLAVDLSLEIDRIEIQGVTALSDQDIEATLDIAPGEKLEKHKVLKTEESLQNLYRTHGYEKAGIQARLVQKRGVGKRLETILEFNVQEGSPSRIAIVAYEVEGASEKTKEMIRKAVKILPGDLFDQERIAEAKRAILEQLASEEHMGARVEQVQIETTSPPQASPFSANQLFLSKTERWVKIIFKIDLGEKVRFGFRGNTVITKAQLDALVDEQRVLGLGKDFVNIIQNRIEDEYRSLGYNQVKIESYSYYNSRQHERQISYVIQEGPRVKIESLQFDGNTTFSSQKLRDQLMAKASANIQHGYYVEKDLQKAAELLIEWVKEKGYLSARLITINAIYPSLPRTQVPGSKVRLVLYVYEGDQSSIQKLDIQGAKVFSEAEIKKILKIQEGMPFNPFSFGEGLESLKSIYRDKGYLNFRILDEGTDNLVQFSQENRLVDISLKLEEGLLFKVGRIDIEGLENTNQGVVKRELLIAPGEVLSETNLTRSEFNLRKLGIFSTVNFHLLEDPEKEDVKNIRISLQEGARGVLEWGPGFRNDLGIRGFGHLSYTNLWGMNHTVFVNLAANRRVVNYQFAEGQAEIAYSWPWFGSPDIKFRPSFSVSRTQYILFSADSVSLVGAWEKPLLAKPQLNASVAYTLERNKIFRRAGDDQTLTIGSVTPALTLDLRDSSLAPTSGFFANTSFDFAHPYLGAQTDPSIAYHRLQLRSDYYVPVSREIVWFFSFRTGVEVNYIPGSVIPLIKQFTLGGVQSLRGYAEQALNKQDTQIGQSLSYVNYRTQLDLPFSGNLKFGLFLDAANLVQDHYSFVDQLRFGTGFGFHYQTPVGPINLDFGFKLAPLPTEEANYIHFSVGII